MQYNLPDGGQLYTETNLKDFIVEPWNAASAFIFLVIACWWWYKLKGRYERYVFLTGAIFLLTVGAVGGTIYHAFRYHAFFMYMDWLPILILCVMTSTYFLKKLLGGWPAAIGVVCAMLLLQCFLYRFVDHQNVLNLNYAIMGAFVLLPTLFILQKNNFYQWRWVSFAFICFFIALFFRIADKWGLLSIGTHFLWHFFGAIAGNFMFLFIYKLKKRELKQYKAKVVSL